MIRTLHPCKLVAFIHIDFAAASLLSQIATSNILRTSDTVQGFLQWILLSGYVLLAQFSEILVIHLVMRSTSCTPELVQHPQINLLLLFLATWNAFLGLCLHINAYHAWSLTLAVWAHAEQVSPVTVGLGLFEGARAVRILSNWILIPSELKLYFIEMNELEIGHANSYFVRLVWGLLIKKEDGWDVFVFLGPICQRI